MRIDILKKIRKDESGAAAIEYAIILALVSVAAIGALTTLGGSLNTTNQNVSNTLAAAIDSGPGNNNAGGLGGAKGIGFSGGGNGGDPGKSGKGKGKGGGKAGGDPGKSGKGKGGGKKS